MRFINVMRAFSDRFDERLNKLLDRIIPYKLL